MGKKITYLFSMLALIIGTTYAQSSLWQRPQNARMSTPDIQPGEYLTLAFNADQMSTALRSADAQHTIDIPLPDGSFEKFILEPSETMSERLKAKYPQIQSYKGHSILEKSRLIRVDYSPSGFHAMILDGGTQTFIDPYSRTAQDMVIVYSRESFVRNNAPKFNCGNTDLTFGVEYDRSQYKQMRENIAAKTTASTTLSGGTLHTYRLAVAATGEYTTFHGGTKAQGLAAITTTINRVNGIYNTEASVAFTLVANTDNAIYTDANSDPFDNFNAQTLIDQSQTVIDQQIGSANYDIGHTVSTGGGGLAGLGVVCNNSRKANGITGSSQPIGDPYDVDFVAHEIGHQFNCPHTFNGDAGSCGGANRSASTAYEPGSGVTIMGYAGICGTQNLQSNSIPYFHANSQERISNFTTTGTASTCGTHTATGNSAPVANAGTGGFTIPINTPFELTGSATDANAGDVLSYSWEQYDLGDAGAPASPTGNAPIFRPFAPTSSPTRTFPKLSDIINNTSTIGEILPSYTRSMQFRFTVRDNNSPGGGVSFDELSFDVSNQAGPFTVTSPNTNVIYNASQAITVTWDVANTNQAPINCQNVTIYLSVDGGNTYPHTLTTSTANDGAEIVYLPVLNTTMARIKIKAADNVFFDISNTNFTIQEATNPDFSLAIDSDSLNACLPATPAYTLVMSAFDGFSEAATFTVTGLPSGATGSFSQNPISSGTTVLNINNLTTAHAGVHPLTITATSASKSHSVNTTLVVLNGIPSVGTLTAPANNAINQSLLTNFTWSSFTGGSSYQLQVATDASFNSMVVNESGINVESYHITTPLTANTTYFWRVKATNSCGESAFSTIQSFTTEIPSCNTFTSTDIPKTIAFNNDAVSTLSVTSTGNITDVDVVNLVGTHTWIEDIDVYLTAPSGTEVHLWDAGAACQNQDDFNMTLDDDASTTIPCPPNGGTYQPKDALAGFNGENAAGTWTLKLTDDFSDDDGSLTGWGIKVCVSTVNANTKLIEGKTIAIYPNPSNDGRFTIENANESTSFTVFSSVGMLITEGKGESIDLSTIAKGIYYVQISQGQHSVLEKLIIE